jgi:hypothetical protein
VHATTPPSRIDVETHVRRREEMGEKIGGIDGLSADGHKTIHALRICRRVGESSVVSVAVVSFG